MTINTNQRNICGGMSDVDNSQDDSSEVEILPNDEDEESEEQKTKKKPLRQRKTLKRRNTNPNNPFGPQKRFKKKLINYLKSGIHQCKEIRVYKLKLLQCTHKRILFKYLY